MWYLRYSPMGKEYGPFTDDERTALTETAKVSIYWSWESANSPAE